MYFPAYRENGLFDVYRDTFLNNKPHQFDFHYEDGYDVFFNIHTVKTGAEVLVTFTDQTALKRLQRDLEASIEELKRSNANFEEFAYAASHDLKEPIRKIFFFSERLKEKMGERLQPEEQLLFERMQTASERMRDLVDDLLTYSHVSMKPKHFDEVNLDQLVNQVLVDLELAVEEKKAQFKIGNLPMVKGHSRQLQQLFQNLLGNSLKYTRREAVPEVKVSARRSTGKETGLPLSSEEQQKSFHVIEVSDNGIGFEQKDAERIFNVFQRLHGNSEYKGTGIGLSIARKVAENHNGYITAAGSPGAGANFCVYLPENAL